MRVVLFFMCWSWDLRGCFAGTSQNKGEEPILLEGCCPACFPASFALLTADYLDPVC